MPQRRVDTQFYGAKAIPINRRDEVPEAKVDPEWERQANESALERYIEARRRRGVVDPTGRDDPRKKNLRNK